MATTHNFLTTEIWTKYDYQIQTVQKGIIPKTTFMVAREGGQGT